MLSAITLPILPATDFLSALSLLFALVIGHALADFPLQGDFLSHGKNRHLPPPKLADGKQPPPSTWAYLMSAHCLIHAGFVWIITGSALLAIAEFVIHFVIDFVKCEGRTSFAVDQWLHIITKAAFVALIWAGLI